MKMRRQEKILNVFGWILGVLTLILLCIIPISAKQQEQTKTVRTLIGLLQKESEIQHELPFNSSRKYGYFGNFCIPELGVTVALNDYAYYDVDAKEVSKEITDGWNSAFVTYHKTTILMGDHRVQEFKPLDKTRIGQTAYIVFPDKKFQLTCVECGHAYNDFRTVWIEAEEWFDRYPNSIFVYTCDEDEHHVLYSVWK